MTRTARHILIPFHDFARGGTERIALNLARSWLDQGRLVTVLCGSRGGGTIDQADPRIRIVELDPPLPRSLTSRLHLGRAMARRLPELAPDAVFIPGNFHYVLGPAFRRAMPDLPIVAKVSNPLLPQLPAPLDRLASKLLAAYTAPIDLLIYMAPELAAQGQRQLPGARCTVIAEPNLPAGHSGLPRQGPASPPLILAVGRLEPQKNFALALEAFRLLAARRDARLEILGEGAERGKLQHLIDRLGLADRVTLAGYVDDIPQRMARASAMLMTSRYEGYPAVVVEALAADLPIVTTPCSPALASLVTTPVHGAIVSHDAGELAEALERVLDLPFVSAGVRPASVAHHDSAASAMAYLAAFDALAAGRAPS